MEMETEDEVTAEVEVTAEMDAKAEMAAKVEVGMLAATKKADGAAVFGKRAPLG